MNFKTIFFAALTVMLVSTIHAQTIPKKPTKGEKFEIRYDPNGGDLEDRKVNCNLYTFGSDFTPTIQEIEMEMMDGYWTTSAQAGHMITEPGIGMTGDE